MQDRTIVIIEQGLRRPKMLTLLLKLMMKGMWILIFIGRMNPILWKLKELIIFKNLKNAKSMMWTNLLSQNHNHIATLLSKTRTLVLEDWTEKTTKSNKTNQIRNDKVVEEEKHIPSLSKLCFDHTQMISYYIFKNYWLLDKSWHEYIG